jgi:uncharacterized protein YjbK
MTRKIEIEVEKKFSFTPEQYADLSSQGTGVTKKIVKDQYLDDENFSLAKKQYWLRRRGDAVELKIPESILADGTVVYKEITNPEEIAEILSIPNMPEHFFEWQRNGFREICFCQTERESFVVDGIKIDIDKANFSGFEYSLGEAEIIVDNESDIKVAETRINNLFVKFGITETRTEGKIWEYFRMKNPDLYAIFIESRNKFRLEQKRKFER